MLVCMLFSNMEITVRASLGSNFSLTDSIEKGEYTVEEEAEIIEDKETEVKVDIIKNGQDNIETDSKDNTDKSSESSKDTDLDDKSKNTEDNSDKKDDKNQKAAKDVKVEEDKEENDKLEAPDNLEITQKSYNSLSIKWNKVKNAKKYEVYRSTKKTSGYKKIKSLNSTSFVDKKLKTGKTYYYKVRAVSENRKSQYTKPKSKKPVPNSVTSFKAKQAGYNSIKLSWKKSKGANRYIIYRSTKEKSGYKRIKTTTSNTFTDKKLSTGRTYYYKVIAYKDKIKGKEAITSAKTKPDKVSDFKAVLSGTNNVKLTWKKTSGAGSYYIYRSEDKGSGYKKIAEVKKTKTSYVDKDLEEEKTYYYKICAVSNKTEGAKSSCSITLRGELDYDEMRAVWISYLDYAPLKDKSKSEFTRNIRSMYDTVLNQELNTVIVQVRAFSDAAYPSDYYPWAGFITSNSNGLDYDPLEIMVNEAHKKGLLFQAWVNPYRTNDGGVYNPASSSTIKRVVNGVKEIVENYDVDGIHMDDYFYLSSDTTDIYDKKMNVNRMVKSVYKSIKSIDENVVFGISPAGNIDYAESIGCDLDTWLTSDGYIDYICPQIYWSDNYVNSSGNTVRMFTEKMNEWKNINYNQTPMYVGLALYKAGTLNVSSWGTDYGWSESNKNLYNQYKLARKNGYSGYSLFRYDFLNNGDTQTELKYLRKLINN